MQIMFRIFYFSLFFVIPFMLASCASFEGDQSTVRLQKFTAWQLQDVVTRSRNTNEAAQDLLRQADELIAENQKEQAAEKLERLLRIEPSSAQAWSRLAWIALQDNRPGRTQQMAQRSNSVAYGNKSLKALNWSFIRRAGQYADDDDLVKKAEDMIKQLGYTMGKS